MKKDGESGKKQRYMDPDRTPFRPPEPIPDTLKVPPNTIYMIPDSANYELLGELQKAPGKRDWFTNFFYFCLPIVFGNQHGFVLRATHSFVCRWDGTESNEGLEIQHLTKREENGLIVDSHFGHGILTVQARYSLRTPEGVNLMVKAPPNFPVHGMSWMDAMVESDNLRRDFTYNIKITRPHLDIYIEKGTPLGCVVPYPRYFIDKYEPKQLEDQVEVAKSIKTVEYFSKERSEYDREQPRLRYMEGKDIYDLTFKEHQKSLDSGAWWREEKPRMDKALKAKAELEKQRTSSRVEDDASSPDADEQPQIYKVEWDPRSMLSDPSIAGEQTPTAISTSPESLPPELVTTFHAKPLQEPAPALSAKDSKAQKKQGKLSKSEKDALKKEKKRKKKKGKK